tara:strand:- start:12976 stop:13269 length:294 start_codon:yes stop_codon:yes gene_type:complete
MSYQELIKYRSSNVNLDSLILNNQLINYTSKEKERQKFLYDDEVKHILQLEKEKEIEKEIEIEIEIEIEKEKEKIKLPLTKKQSYYSISDDLLYLSF